MSTNKTTHLNLHQWAQTDPIHRTEFNENFEHIDSAVGTLQTAIQTAGNCQVVYGTYTGTGVYDSDHPNTLTFDGKPLLVVVRKNTGKSGSTSDQKLIMVWDCNWCNSDSSTSSFERVSWSGNSVSWYNLNGASTQLNAADTVYHYIALLVK